MKRAMDLEDHAFFDLLLRHPVVEMGQRRRSSSAQMRG
jgi:hypothetical protein